MKRVFVLLVLPFVFAACSRESSSGEAPSTMTSTTPSATASAPATPPASAAPTASASAAPTAKPTAGAPSSLPFCKGTNFGTEPLLALCAMGQDWSKAHFECVKPLPRNFCADLSVWGCQYIASNGEKTPRVTFDARFVRGGVALSPGEMIDDNTLRARFPRAGTVRGVTVQTLVTGSDEGLKVSVAQTKKLVAAGCVVSQSDKPGSSHLECGSWQAHVWIDGSTTVNVDADLPTSPDCTK
ncbi:MAG: hypothetical protein ABI461_07830 [Polyangiaceae bacterium]